jgi:heme/copper-type cytochrome/quinol oxidase subunit 4
MQKQEYQNLIGTSESTHYQLKSYFIQYVFLSIICLIVFGLIIRSSYLEKTSEESTTDTIILFVASTLVFYKVASMIL